MLFAWLSAPLLPAHAATPPAADDVQRETFEDWQTVCAVRDGKRLCAVIQERAASQAGSDLTQRIFAIELKPEGDGAAGTLILPFGLDLTQGVTLVLGEGQAGPAQPFRTCLPSGCIVSLQFGPEALVRLRTAGTLELRVTALADDAQKTLPVSLKGFGAAFDRARELAR
ncbi:MAG TPA: invasion associated locus B family protein [Croceibacterium sp.]|nr:invasion associated locus B family protein [Croceibacterium sp.]